jgi:hypothetical protein
MWLERRRKLRKDLMILMSRVRIHVLDMGPGPPDKTV